LDAADYSPVVVARRLWGWFELLPFRRGVALLASALAVPALVVGGILMLGPGSGSQKDSSSAPVRHSPVRAAAPPAPTWGEYVPPRSAKPTHAPARQRSAPVTAGPRPTRPAGPRSSRTACPPGMKKWPWMRAMCMRKHSGQGRP
jgi:hypothetical protein